MIKKLEISNLFEKKILKKSKGNSENIQLNFLSHKKKKKNQILKSMILFGTTGSGKTCIFNNLIFYQKMILQGNIDLNKNIYKKKFDFT